MVELKGLVEYVPITDVFKVGNQAGLVRPN